MQLPSTVFLGHVLGLKIQKLNLEIKWLASSCFLPVIAWLIQLNPLQGETESGKGT